jgi:diguanylate cyclase (GGDEF)-like protein
VRLALIVTCALGTPGIAAAQAERGASAAAAQAPALPTAELKARIASDDRRRPVASITLAEQALTAATLTPEDRHWLRTRLVLDLIRIGRADDAIAQAKLGRQQAGEARDRLHFDQLQMMALVDLHRHQEALGLYGEIAASLPPLAGNTRDTAGRLIAAGIWRLAGAAMLQLNRLPESMELLTRALRILDERPDAAFELSQTLDSISSVHLRSGHVDEALSTVQRAIDASEAAGERAILSTYYLRKAHYLSMLGRTDEQHEALLKARSLARDELRDFNIGVAATNLADVALQKKDYRNALRYAEEAVPLVERTGDKESLWVCWVNKGIALNRLGRPDGIEWIRKAVAAFVTAENMSPDYLADIHGALAEELAFSRDYQHAYETAMEFKRLTEEARKAADHKRIAEASAAYEADKRQRQIEALEQEQQYQQRFRWMLTLAAAAGLAAAIIAGISRHHVKRAYGAMRDMAFSDPLTGLRNRRHLVSTVQEDLAQARRLRANAGESAANADMAFMMIDIDHFKAVNDVHGHAAGDAVLKQCAAVLQRQLRESDTVVRWGGEEFLVLARQANEKDIHLLAERLRASVAAHEFVLDDGQVLRKTCSIGYACHPLETVADVPPADWNDTLDLADQCLYTAKASGRDLWVGIASHDARRALEQPGIRELRAGVAAGIWTLRCSHGREIIWPAA